MLSRKGTPTPLLYFPLWDERCESHRSREVRRPTWFTASNDLSADLYTQLAERGPEFVGIWIALQMVASRSPRRGYLQRENGLPHDSDSLSRAVRMPKAAIDTVLEFLRQVGEVKIASEKARKKSVLAPRNGATERDSGAVTSRGTGPDKTEHKRTSSSQDIHDMKGHSSSSSISERRTDLGSKPKPKEGQKSLDDDGLDGYEPREALKEIYRRKTGELPPLATLEAIDKALLKSGVPLNAYVEEIRKHHLLGTWKNPSGFLISLAKEFLSRTTSTAAPLTIQATAERDYQCLICKSRKKGEGLMPGVNGGMVPCACASEEYIERMKKRGVIATQAS